MFVPFVYSALWIYFCIKNYYKTNKIITKELLIILIVTLLIPFILGYIYHLAPNVYAIIINKTIATIIVVTAPADTVDSNNVIFLSPF